MGCSPSKNQNKKEKDFVDMIILKVLNDSPFSRNQPLKSADDNHIGISVIYYN
jgi:hypothetical protein